MAQRSRRRALPSAWPLAGGRITVGLVVGRLTEGAIQRQLVALARGLDRRRHAVVVYCLSAYLQPHGPQLEAEGHTVRQVQGRSDTRRLVALARALRRDGIDVVHGFGWSGGAYASLAARLARIVTVVASVPRAADRGSGAAGYLRGEALRRATVVLAESHAEAARLQAAFAVPAERIRIVYDGVALARFRMPTRFEGLRDRVRGGPLLVAASAPWTSDEARATIATAAGAVLAARPDARFLWLVPREHAAATETWWRDHAFPATIVTDADGRARDLGRATVVWAVGSERTVLTCIVEAMAAGRAVIASRSADSERIIVDGATGLLCDARDGGGLAAATIELAHGAGRRRELGQAARTRVERCFSVTQLVADVAAVYQHALLGLIDAAPASDAGADPAAALVGRASIAKDP